MPVKESRPSLVRQRRRYIPDQSNLSYFAPTLFSRPTRSNPSFHQKSDLTTRDCRSTRGIRFESAKAEAPRCVPSTATAAFELIYITTPPALAAVSRRGSSSVQELL